MERKQLEQLEQGLPLVQPLVVPAPGMSAVVNAAV